MPGVASLFSVGCASKRLGGMKTPKDEFGGFVLFFGFVAGFGLFFFVGSSVAQ